MVDLKANQEILGNSESLNEELRKLQNTLYEKILVYLNSVDPNNNLPNTLYDENHESNLDKLTQYFKTSQNHDINLFYEHRHDPVTTLADWRNKMVIG
jgi:GTPase involved in cell partitioning and DNA repair